MGIGGKIKLEEGTAGGTYVGFKAPDTEVASDLIWVLPAADGTAGQLMSTDGAMNIVWSDEPASRLAADSTLTANLNSEVTSRLNSDSTLTANLNSEVTSRLNSDSTLTANINTEITARSNADSTLQANVTSVTRTVYTKTSAYTAVKNDYIFADSTGGAFNITLPSSATAGDRLWVVDYKSQFATNGVTLLRNGLNIKGSASDYLCNVSGKIYVVEYEGASWGWSVLN